MVVLGAGFGASELGPLPFLAIFFAYNHVGNLNIKSF